MNKPKDGETYRLTSFANGDKSIANGNTWQESRVKDKSEN